MEFAILKDIVIIFALSTLVNLVFTRIKVPTALGYLVTGIIAGPHLLSLISDRENIELLAEIGVILLLFTIGMEFSLKHLLKIRRIVFWGGLLQVSVTAGAFYLASKPSGLSWQTGIFIGFLAALSSSALVLKLLQERSELTSNYGRTILGILIFQDLLLVPLLLFTDLLGNASVDVSSELLILSLKTIFIIALVYVGNKWLLPKLLHQIALAKNEELFMMCIFLICLAIALLTSWLGMSLAFGAFLAGLMISESEYSHNAFANLIPFKDTFTSFFFVSIGMLLDMSFVIDNYQLVILSVILVITLKTIIAGGTGFLLGHTFRGTLMVGLALSQVGEFSFILAKIGLENSILSEFYYQLFLGVAVITMALTPFLMNVSIPLANTLLKLPLPKFIVDGIFPLPEIAIPDMKNHLVIIGKDSSAIKLSKMAKINDIKHVSIIFDPLIAKGKIENGETTVYGDAVNVPILMKAHVDTADIVVISVGSIIPSLSIVEKVRRLNKKAYIIVRVKHIQDVEEFYKLGADQVLPEKLEVAIDLFNRVLIKRLYPQREMNRILTHIRSMSLGEFTEKDTVNKPSLLDDLPNLNITALKIDANSMADGKLLSDIELRKKTGVTLLAVKRGNQIIEHPLPDTAFQSNDILYVLGNHEQTNLAFELFFKEI
ncbi:MAG: sodium:proton exchanger [Bacteroidetes bacterium GWF2_42_66]|nr:MAG: sodium:proton exchanger [Bacteroidetes bacterium GWA2_42_15]OFX99214.1 MAG: sodium:proton exchanger [Bacteroidetes bacterium GWE2_42_39]OFY40610.1 MAG: sodium:proton exchanger [Bacteroidetes bacterium GWF2_42_66]HBL74565.1 sodium:proton exchanger [Prolixibacteraceae bacterium]HCR88987.1 sodium:proton exchanger [Prolixibacteraceae bacterium]